MKGLLRDLKGDKIKPNAFQFYSLFFKELGEVLELSLGTESSRYDGNAPNPHPHLICTECKKIIDPDLESLEDISQELIKETGFSITVHRLDFFGICPECQKK